MLFLTSKTIYQAEWDKKNVNKNSETGEPAPQQHLISSHSWAGIIAVALYLFQFIVGLVTFYLPMSPNWFRAAYVSLAEQF